MTITKLILIAVMNLTSDAHAGDDWLCTTQASQRRSNAILACGVAIAKDEPEARAKAFQAAMEEFHRVCDSSVDCVGHEIQIMPQRTECEASGSGEKCYRLLAVYIGHNYTPVKRIKTVVAQVEVQIKREVAQVTKVFKLKRGVSKAAVLAAFGPPYDVVQYDDETLFYNNRLCRPIAGNCYVSFKQGKMVSALDIDTQYLDLK